MVTVNMEKRWVNIWKLDCPSISKLKCVICLHSIASIFRRRKLTNCLTLTRSVLPLTTPSSTATKSYSRATSISGSVALHAFQWWLWDRNYSVQMLATLEESLLNLTMVKWAARLFLEIKNPVKQMKPLELLRVEEELTASETRTKNQ